MLTLKTEQKVSTIQKIIIAASILFFPLIIGSAACLLIKKLCIAAQEKEKITSIYQANIDLEQCLQDNQPKNILQIFKQCPEIRNNEKYYKAYHHALKEAFQKKNPLDVSKFQGPKKEAALIALLKEDDAIELINEMANTQIINKSNIDTRSLTYRIEELIILVFSKNSERE